MTLGLLLLLLYIKKCTSSQLFIISCAFRSLEKLKFQQDSVFTGSLPSMLTVQAVIFINLLLFKWNSEYLTTDARNDLEPAASFYINSVNTRLIRDELDRCIQLVLSNDGV